MTTEFNLICYFATKIGAMPEMHTGALFRECPRVLLNDQTAISSSRLSEKQSLGYIRDVGCFYSALCSWNPNLPTTFSVMVSLFYEIQAPLVRGVQMKFVDELLNKFKKVDESDRDRLKAVRSQLPEPEPEVEVNLCENKSMGSGFKVRSAPSKSITRLRAFVKQKTVEEMAAEDAQRRKAQEDFTNTALNDIGQH